jgi:hypothetical protein
MSKFSARGDPKSSVATPRLPCKSNTCFQAQSDAIYSPSTVLGSISELFCELLAIRAL